MPYHARKTPADPNVGLRIEVCLLRNGISQKELAKKLGVTPSAVSHWVHGRHLPRGMLRPLAEALGVSVGWLSGEHATEIDQNFEKAYLESLLYWASHPDVLRKLAKEHDWAKQMLNALKKSRAKT